jgi:hypothetical protein
MNQHDALLIHTLPPHAHVDSPESVHRREHLLLLEREIREARSRRRRERIRRGLNALIAFHRSAPGLVQRTEAPRHPRSSEGLA